MNKNGYTMAEMLVTLALIGVLAGLVYPAVRQQKPNMALVNYKKIYNAVVRASEELLADDALYPYGRQFGLEDKSPVNYMGHVHKGDTKFGTLLEQKLNGTYSGSGTFDTPDGIHVSVDKFDITVDVLNGICSVKPGYCVNKTTNFGMTVDKNAIVSPKKPNAKLAKLYLEETNYAKKESEFAKKLQQLQ